MESTEPESCVLRYRDDVFEAVIALVDEGMSTRKAAAACGVSSSTGWIGGWLSPGLGGLMAPMAGLGILVGRRFHQLRQQGRSVDAAAAAVGVSSGSGYRWDQEVRAAASAPVRRLGPDPGV